MRREWSQSDSWGSSPAFRLLYTMDDKDALKTLRNFLGWVKDNRPHIVAEYIETLKEALKDLEDVKQKKYKI